MNPEALVYLGTAAGAAAGLSFGAVWVAWHGVQALAELGWTGIAALRRRKAAA